MCYLYSSRLSFPVRKTQYYGWYTRSGLLLKQIAKCMLMTLMLFSGETFADTLYQFGYQYYERLNIPVGGKNNKGFLLANFDYQGQKEKMNTKAEFNFRFYPHNAEGVYSFPEVFVSYKKTWFDLTLGRKIIDFAPAEKFWLLGEINPVRGFNLLEEKQEGLMGAHLDLHFRRSSLSFIASLIHIPQINPTYKIKSGKVRAPNEWSKLPPTKARFNGQDMQIYYNLIKPDLDRILIHPTTGIRYKYEWSENSGAQAFALFKPEPGIRMKATGFYEQNTVERASVFVKPFVNKHIIMGGEIYQQFSFMQLRVGLWHFDPQKGPDKDFNFTALRIEPTYTTEDYFYTKLSGIWNKINWSANFLDLISRDNRTDDLFAKVSKWRRAIGASIDWQFLEKHSLDFNYRLDFSMHDHIVNANWNYHFLGNAHLLVGFEFIAAPSAFSYWGPYRTNDSLFAQVNYVF